MRILTVDDEFVCLTKMTTLLSEVGECDAATNGKQALEMFSRAISDNDPYRLVTIDIEMPEIDGLELLRIMRDTERRARIPYARKLMISSAVTSHNVGLAAKNECDGFIVKPVKRDVLFAKLAEFGITP